MRNHSLYLKDILEAMEAIEQFVADMNYESFSKNDMVSSAVIRKFEIIGEAAKALHDSIKQEDPEIPWREMAGMRDKLIHFYFGVKHELVWQTIKDVIPQVKPQIQRLLANK